MIEYFPNQDFSGTLSSILEDQGTGIDAQENLKYSLSIKFLVIKMNNKEWEQV